LALYHDRHSIFEHTENGQESLEEQLAGKKRPTQLGRLLEELGITSITSYSPQAKGRVERLWGTFQDRLVSELRLAGTDSKDAANRVLWDFLPRFNVRFPVPTAQPGSAYVKPDERFVPEEVFCFKYERTVGIDNVVQFGEYRLQIMPNAERTSYARARVQVHERMDGSLAVYYQGHCLVSQSAPSEARVLRTRKYRMPDGLTQDMPSPSMPSISAKPLEPILARQVPGPVRPSHNHPWRRHATGFATK